MAFDTFLKIEGPDLKGESTATGYEGQIEVYSFSWGASNPVTVGSGATGLSGGKVSISSFNIMKKTETSSAPLFNACASGQHYDTATVTMRKAGGTAGQQIFLTYVFTDVMVESIQWSGSSGGDDSPSESLSIGFRKVTIAYQPQGNDGAAKGGEKTASWDIGTNTK